MSFESRKRPTDGSYMANERPGKRSRTGSTLDKIKEGEGRSTLKPERLLEPAYQVYRYLLEMFSVPLLQSHATASLVDRDRLQLYHTNRSVVLVSSPIDFSGGDGLDRFIATIIAFWCLSFEQNGVLETLSPSNTDLVRISEVVLGEIISRDPATVGRSTVVVDATSVRWPKTKLAIKVSWPGSGRVPEADFLKKAKDETEKPGGKWAINHLPRMLHASDGVVNEDPTFESGALLPQNGRTVCGQFQYERRILRVIIQERLDSLKSLTNVKDIGQVFLDIACCTCLSLSLILIHLHRFSSSLAPGQGRDPPP